MRTTDENQEIPKQGRGTKTESSIKRGSNQTSNRSGSRTNRSRKKKGTPPSASVGIATPGTKNCKENSFKPKSTTPVPQVVKKAATPAGEKSKDKPSLKQVKPAAKQETQYRVHGEIFSWQDTEKFCKLDGAFYAVQSKPASEIQEYVDKNIFGYYIASNTWMLLLQDLSKDSLPEIARSILSGGLAPMITLANSLSNALILGEQLPPSPFGYFIRSVTDSRNADEIMRYTLQGLRFLKRFSPINTTSLINDELIEFQRRNTSMKLFDRVSISPVYVLGLRHVLRDTFSGWEGYHRESNRRFDYFSHLPENATCDTRNTRVDKWASIVERYPFVSQLCPPSSINVNSHKDAEFEYRYCSVSAIPKSYKARRIIATEECYRQTKMWTIMNTLDTCLNNTHGFYAPGGRALMHDQDRNRQLAREGSVDNYYATLDCSAASDTVSWWLVREVFPPALFREMNKLRSEYMKVRINGAREATSKTLYMFSSMGSRMTFPVEMILFWGIACYGCTVASHLLGDHFDPSEVSVFGDDTIVPSKYADTVLHFLKVFGFSPNYEKSFYKEEGFRESCGIECYHGLDVSSVYFPRSSVTDDTAGAIRLISLQHRVFQHRLTSNFLCSVLSTHHKVLYSLPYQPNNCLWVDFPDVTIGKIPRNTYKLDNDEAYEFACDNSNMDDYIVETKVTTTYEASKSSLSNELADQLLYLEFLKEGPRYDNQLDRKDGISLPPVKRSAYTGPSTSHLRNLRK